jgi:3-oxoacyl-[acyl-carrier protein] reductase
MAPSHLQTPLLEEINMELHGKRALITGGSRGIGAAIAETFAKQGADVAVTYNQSAQRAAEVVNLAQQQGRQAIAIQADSADPAAIGRAVGQTLDTLGGIDILVNNAGISRVAMIADLAFADLQALLDINVRAPVLFTQAIIPHLPVGGRVITIGSFLGDRVPFPTATAYAMSKASLTSFTRGLSRELGPRDITVNLVQPGLIDTEMNPADGQHAEFLTGFTSSGRFGTPNEVASLVAFLASPAAGLITGAVINADGGASA